MKDYEKTALQSQRNDGGNNYSAPGDESIWEKPGEIIQELIRRNVMPGDIVVDGASGDGRYTETLAEAVGENGHIINIDLDQSGLDRLSRRFEEKYGDRIENIQADLTKPFPPYLANNSVDKFLCIGFAHLPKKEVVKDIFFPEVMRILKPDGSFFGNFLVNIVRTDLSTGHILPTKDFAEQDYTEEEGITFLMECFSEQGLEAQVYRNLSIDYESTKPPYHLSGASIVYEVKK